MRASLFFLFVAVLLACQPSLPEAQGVYVYAGKELVCLDSVKIDNAHINNLCGIKVVSQSFESVDSLYINANQGNYVISRLKYHNGMFVEGVSGHRKWLKTEFWIAEEEILFTKKMNNDGKAVVLIPASKLVEGCYAIHQNQLNNCYTIGDSMHCFAFKIKQNGKNEKDGL